ncbi:hypothetical protein COLO4_03455 [Corchorus olitorius]|uniref:Uncharacterized protein n=1 Tax=Corchorus olitorius TaxID=93759 RepID=A0A1R3KYM6_9ROSI|nr:hypothetical protein COLO4_03455 [Corchorus olitorius]
MYLVLKIPGQLHVLHVTCVYSCHILDEDGIEKETAAKFGVFPGTRLEQIQNALANLYVVAVTPTEIQERLKRICLIAFAEQIKGSSESTRPAFHSQLIHILFKELK